MVFRPACRRCTPFACVRRLVVSPRRLIHDRHQACCDGSSRGSLTACFRDHPGRDSRRECCCQCANGICARGVDYPSYRFGIRVINLASSLRDEVIMHVRDSRSLPVAGVFLIAALAGCGNAASPSAQSGNPNAAGHSTTALASAQPSESASATQSSSVSPGHDSPEAAADGFLQGELLRKRALACSYVEPATQSICTSAMSQAPAFTGSLAVVSAVISGNLALAEVIGHECTNGAGCSSNANSSSGLPSGSLTFKRAYNEASNSTNSFTPVPCIKVNGMWYVNLT